MNVEKLNRRWRSLAKSERNAIAIAAIMLIAAIVLVAFLKLVGIGESATIVAVMLVPLLVYGVASGKIQEFSAPGGRGAKFRQAATDPVDPTPITADMRNFENIQKRGPAALRRAGQDLEAGQPIALTMEAGRTNYTPQEIKKYIETLSVFDPNTTVVIVDRRGKFVAMAEAMSVLRAVSTNSPSRSALVNAIGNDDRAFLKKNAGFVTEALKVDASNADALARMQAENLRTMVVVDAASRPTGIVRRDDIVSRLLVTLAAPQAVSA